jgi:hypothetical protein
MTHNDRPTYRLLTRASESRCQHCPPERVCAWGCVQGASYEDILIGAVLEQSHSWALETPEAGIEASREALWETFNT